MTEEHFPKNESIGEEDVGQGVEDSTYSDQPGKGDPPIDPGRRKDRTSPNGIHAATGAPWLPPLTADELVARVFRRKPPEELEEAGKVIPPDLDGDDLGQTGWGVIFPEDVDPAVEEALSELVEYRQSQAGWLFQRFSRQAGETSRRFLARHGVGPGVVDPEIVPYHLLVVGGPEEIPFSFQYQLGLGYSVGRLAFDEVEDYRRYTRHVVEAETRGVRLPRVVSLFGVEGDATTQRTARQLIVPLSERLGRRAEDWQIRLVLRQEATKDRLRALLGGGETPGLLVTSSHGVAYDRDDPRQEARQGGLLCREWPGFEEPVAVAPDHVFCGEDVPPDVDLRGLFAFLFACYGVGTPRENDFVHESGPPEIAPRPFVARLPQRLLRQGALGVIGHVDRAWTCTFSWTEKGGQIQTPATVLEQLLVGHRAGHAVSFFGHRHAELAGQLHEVWQELFRHGAPGDDKPSAFLAWLWTATNDARNMILLGDPAARRVEAKA